MQYYTYFLNIFTESTDFFTLRPIQNNLFPASPKIEVISSSDVDNNSNLTPSLPPTYYFAPLFVTTYNPLIF